ncbi:MAG: hypothetical protein K9L79_03630 [Methylobacter tundripaludum]|nr:hypothetical protein [Methylobacter tundripaludum]
MYLNSEIFNWPYDYDSQTGFSEDFVYRAHEIWRHAKDCIADDPTEFDRIDCISSLRRAINHRLKSIASGYRFDDLPSLRPKRQTLEKLQDYGIVRPALIKDLLEVRNLIEHEDAEPPPAERCSYYVDIVWYFLKSTDSLVTMYIDVLTYQEDGDNSSLDLKVCPEKSWTIEVRGRVRTELIQAEQEPMAAELKNLVSKKIRGRPSLVNITASLVTTEALLTKIAREYFGAAGYWYDDHV